jgi:hypothetical protein
MGIRLDDVQQQPATTTTIALVSDHDDGEQGRRGDGG